MLQDHRGQRNVCVCGREMDTSGFPLTGLSLTGGYLTSSWYPTAEVLAICRPFSTD